MQDDCSSSCGCLWTSEWKKVLEQYNFKNVIQLEHRVKIWKINDIYTQRQGEGESWTKGEHWSTPFYSSVPPLIRPESGEHRQKNAACHGERAQWKVLALWSRGWGGEGLEGWPAGVTVWKALFVSGLTPDPTHTLPISSVSNFLVLLHPIFP